MSKVDFVEISDLESVKRALENAEIDYEEDYDGGVAGQDTVLTLDNGICFYFDNKGQMNGISP